VRKLAERSSRGTSQIAELIAQVQAGTREAVSAMETGSTRVEHGSQMAARAGRTLDQILQAVETSPGQMSAIATSSQHMAAGARGVTDGMQQQRAATEQVMASAQEMTAQVEEISTQAAGLAATARQLDNLVARFTLDDDVVDEPTHLPGLRRVA
jgi:methyl-accepting chemotaxis protein